MPRFANQRIAELVDYIKTPHVSREMGVKGDPYFYGQSGNMWRTEQDNLHREIQQRILTEKHAKAILTTKFGMSKDEANRYYNWSINPNNEISRHVHYGVPQATTSEIVMNKILNASGINTELANKGDPTATDLSRMVGNVRQYIDVQNRNTWPDPITGEEMGTLMPILRTPRGVAPDVFYEAAGSDNFAAIKAEIQRRSPIARPGKMFESKEVVGQRFGPKDSPFPESHVKDLVIGGHNHPRSFNTVTGRKYHGPYDPVLPSNIIVQDQKKLRDNLMAMTKDEYLKQGGEVLDDDYRTSLDLKLPVRLIEELSKPDSEYISREVMETLDAYRAGKFS